MNSNVHLVLKGKSKDLGDGFVVRRSLPSIKKRLVGPFIFWDHMGPTCLGSDQEMVVRAHPHIGLSTITYLFSGKMTHRDSLGNKVDIQPGEVNWMTAGSGISHSERIAKRSEPMDLEGIQLWVALPKDREEVPPSFVHHKERELPLIDHEGFQLRLIAGEALQSKSPLPVFSPLFYLNGKSQQEGQMLFPMKPNHEGALYVVDGKIEIENEIHPKFSLIVFKRGQPIQLKSQGPCEFMIFGGEPFPESPHIWWNFVSHKKENIEKAKERWRNNEFGHVIDESEKIPLPEN